MPSISQYSYVHCLLFKPSESRTQAKLFSDVPIKNNWESYKTIE